MNFVLALLLTVAAYGQSVPMGSVAAAAPSSPITLISSSSVVQSSDGLTVTTGGINTTGATVGVAVVATLGYGTQTSLFDNMGNTGLWSAVVTPSNDSSAGRVTVWTCAGCIFGAGHTVTVAAVGGYIIKPTVQLLAFGGTRTSGVVDTYAITATHRDGSVQAGSVTPSANGYLVISATAVGFFVDTILPTINDVHFAYSGRIASTGNATMFGAAYYVQPTTASLNPTWTASLSYNQMQAISVVLRAP